MAQTTKRALAESFVRLLARKTLDKITISDITAGCGVNRQTFYYHFRDVYDLMGWMFRMQTEEILAASELQGDWMRGTVTLFCYLKEKEGLMLNVYHSLSHEQLEDYLYGAMGPIVGSIVEEHARGRRVRPEDRALVASFYQHAFCSIALNWLRHGMKDDPETLVRQMERLFLGSVDALLVNLGK